MGCIQARLRYNTSNALTMKSFSRVNKKVFRSSHNNLAPQHETHLTRTRRTLTMSNYRNYGWSPWVALLPLYFHQKWFQVAAWGASPNLFSSNGLHFIIRTC